MADDPVLLTIEDTIATVAINRPAARNGLVRGMGGLICGMLRQLAADTSIRVVVFRGVGDDFCPGADLKYRPAPSAEVPAPDFDAYEVTVLLHEMPQVTLAAIRGACAGAGFGWACACDMRVADDTARFNTAFLDVGVAGDMGVPWTLPRIVGAGFARALMFQPRKLTAAEAYALGLVEYLWPEEKFEAELSGMANRLAAAAPLAIAAMKAHFIAAEGIGLRSFVELEAERHVELLQTADHLEARTAWLEKRRPRFEAR